MSVIFLDFCVLSQQCHRPKSTKSFAFQLNIIIPTLTGVFISEPKSLFQKNSNETYRCYSTLETKMPSLPHKHTVKVTGGKINRLQLKETTNIFCGA